VYGPLANGATSLMFEGIPNYPDWSRFWQVIDKHKVNIFYTAPTAIRSLMRAGDDWVKKTSRKSLRILGSVGEPINPRPGSGIIMSSAKNAARISTHGGRPKPAAT
jgi:acetyl-CoA synthetase